MARKAAERRPTTISPSVSNGTFATAGSNPVDAQPVYQTYTSNRVASNVVPQPMTIHPPSITPSSMGNVAGSYVGAGNYVGASPTSSGSVTPGLAKQKANQAAQMGLRGHLGGGLGGARFEGVGWSNVSPQQAIESCCYWGQRPTAQIGCTRGADGFWYACVLYY